MNEIKYIVIKIGKMPETAIVFSGFLVHSMFVPNVDECKVISGGYCTLHFYDGALLVKCYGKSTSLKVDSRPIEDADLIRRMLARDIGNYFIFAE